MSGPQTTMRFKAVKVLPAETAAAIRRASVPPHLRTLFANLPGPIAVEARVVASDVPPTVRQLIKLATSGGACRLDGVLLVDDPRLTRVLVTRGGRQHQLEGTALQQDVATVVRELIVALFRPDELPELLEELASQTSTLATLQSVTRHMLEATDVERALGIMLSGITAGYSLGFNRAVLFVRNPQTGRFIGARAVGPDSTVEAHQVWERIESEDKSIEDLIRDHDGQPGNSALQERARSLEFSLSEDREDEFAMAARADGPVLLRRDAPVNPALRMLGARGEYVVAALRPQRECRGLLLADNVFSRMPISRTRLRLFHVFIDQAALVWENLLLLKELERLARYDGLTGVLTRREFDTRLAEELARAARGGHPCGLLIVDVDRFKDINDSQGHEAGDEILRSLGEVLRETLRSTDLVGRFGGDEFVVFLPDVPAPHLQVAAERLGKAAARRGISLSMGGAHHPRDCADPAQLFAMADAQLYRAKNLGRGRACVAPGDDVVTY